VFGQYLAHDLTADRSPVTHHDDSELLRNARSARLNLECLYGDGPVGSPYLYSRLDPGRLLVGTDDLPRNQEGIALAGDPRQDVHLLISQMQVAMIRAHNRLVDRLREDGMPELALFDEARRALTWHYQWVALHDFLPATVGEERAARLLDEGPRLFPYRGTVAIPLEFADAAFRFGHSQMRHTYRLQPGGPELTLMPGLMGFRPTTADRVVDWSLLLDVPGAAPAQRARRIDGRLPESLMHLPVDITGEPGGRRARGPGLVGRDAALVLPAQGSGRPRGRRAAGAGRLTGRRRGARGHRGRRPRVAPVGGQVLAAYTAQPRAGPVHTRRPADPRPG
jgi:hypothetical protein